MSRVTYHVSYVTFVLNKNIYISILTIKLISRPKTRTVVKLFGGGSVINGAKIYATSYAGVVSKFIFFGNTYRC